MFAAPFLPLSSGEKASFAGACFVGAECLFWLGVLIAGKDFVSRFTVYLKPSTWKALLTESVAEPSGVAEPITEEASQQITEKASDSINPDIKNL